MFPGRFCLGPIRAGLSGCSAPADHASGAIVLRVPIFSARNAERMGMGPCIQGPDE